MLPTITWDENKVILIDQRRLPTEEEYLECLDYIQVAEAIEDMAIRGAPAIGVAAAYGAALGILRIEEPDDLDESFERVLTRLGNTRPTARNLFWALERMRHVFDSQKHLPLPELKQKLIREAKDIDDEDVEINKKIGLHGRDLIEDGQNILTHCNAGALATSGYGTALGVIRAAREQGKNIRVFADETRPLLQGARLTCWELDRDSIPVVLITDNMAGYMMQKGRISAVITGADRIARNGDTANKIGTYSVAVLAREHNLPFYVAAPLSTIDFSLEAGEAIPIEERSPAEVKCIAGTYIAGPDIDALNPAFDVTPAEYITAIITEKGIAQTPFEPQLKSFRE
jgi:methylthioribose-1-phosphate isomerase